ncbi:MAG: sugar phosphate isomerase/epimerase family protein [Acidobacteriaceae bacterium]
MISRRNFLKVGAAAAITVPYLSEVLAEPLGKPPGIQLYTVADALQADVPGTIHKLRKIGYRMVESFHYKGFNAQTLRSALDEVGLSCPSCHLPLGHANLDPSFEEAHVLGAHYAVSTVLLPPGHVGSSGGHTFSTLTADDFKRIAALMNSVATKARSAGLQYAYHNHNFEFRRLNEGQIGYDILLSETDPSLVKFELDCGWMAVAGYSPVEYFERYPRRYRMMHVKDFVKGSKKSTSLQGPLRPVGTELGRGMPDYRPIFAAAAKTAIQYYFVEQEPPFVGMTSLQAAEVDYAYLETI